MFSAFSEEATLMQPLQHDLQLMSSLHLTLAQGDHVGVFFSLHGDRVLKRRTLFAFVEFLLVLFSSLSSLFYLTRGERYKKIPVFSIKNGVKKQS